MDVLLVFGIVLGALIVFAVVYALIQSAIEVGLRAVINVVSFGLGFVLIGLGALVWMGNRVWGNVMVLVGLGLVLIFVIPALWKTYH